MSLVSATLETEYASHIPLFQTIYVVQIGRQDAKARSYEGGGGGGQEVVYASLNVHVLYLKATAQPP